MNVLNATKLYPLNWVILYYVNFTAVKNKQTGSHLNIKEKKKERERHNLFHTRNHWRLLSVKMEMLNY